MPGALLIVGPSNEPVLTLADVNEEGANVLIMLTRQSLGASNPSMAFHEAQSVMLNSGRKAFYPGQSLFHCCMLIFVTNSPG